MSREPAMVDLRGVPMPEHLRAAAATVERAATDGALTVLTDQETVLKYAPAAAAQRGLRCLCRRYRGDGGGWEIHLGPGEAPADGGRAREGGLHDYRRT